MKCSETANVPYGSAKCNDIRVGVSVDTDTSAELTGNPCALRGKLLQVFCGPPYCKELGDF